MVSEEKILVKSVLIPKTIALLRELGEQKIRNGELDLKLADKIENAPVMEALALIHKYSDKFLRGESENNV